MSGLIPSVSAEQTLAIELAEHVQERQRLLQEIKDLQEVADGHSEEIKARLIALGASDTLVTTNRGVFKLTYNPFAERSTLDKVALVEAGVTTEQIQRATKVTQFVKLDVREVKQK